MAQYAIAYAPNLTGGTPSSTQKTGSFYIGNLIQGKTWNQAVPQSTTNHLIKKYLQFVSKKTEVDLNL